MVAVVVFVSSNHPMRDLASLGHLIIRRKINTWIRNDEVQRREARPTRLYKLDFAPFFRLLRIPAVDETLQMLLPGLCAGQAEVVPDEAREDAQQTVEERAEGERVERRFDLCVEVGYQEAEVVLGYGWVENLGVEVGVGRVHVAGR